MHVQNNNYIRLGDMHANTKLIYKRKFKPLIK